MISSNEVEDVGIFKISRKTRGVINQNVDVGFNGIRTHVCPRFHRFEISSAARSEMRINSCRNNSNTEI